jgi:O-antigen/teichoic acid export membrane protein
MPRGIPADRYEACRVKTWPACTTRRMSALGTLPRKADLDPAVVAVPRSPATSMRKTHGLLMLSVLSLAASFVNYGSNLAFARVLSPASYGDLTSLLALSVVLAVPLAAAQTRVASRVAAYATDRNWDRVQDTVRHALAHLTVVAVCATALYCAAIPLVADVFHLQAVGPAIALAPLVFVGFLFPTLQGTLQGLERWVAFGAVGLAVALSRVVFGIPWAAAGGGAGGAITGQAIGMLICLGGLLWMLRSHLRRTGEPAIRSGLRRRPDIAGVTAGAAFVCFAVIANGDVVLAKIFLNPTAAGEYAALATIGKMVTFLPAAVSVIIVPKAARAGASRGDRTRILQAAALMVTGAAMLAIIPAALESTTIVNLMFGHRYLAMTSGVLPILCAGGGLAVLYLLVIFTVTIGDSRWTWLLALGVALQVGLIAIFHHSVTQVAGAQAAAVLALLVINEARYHSLLPWPHRV